MVKMVEGTSYYLQDDHPRAIWTWERFVAQIELMNKV